MPDITMCSGKGCDERGDCYRFQAKPSMRQSYFPKPPFTPVGGGDHGEPITTCEYIIRIGD